MATLMKIGIALALATAPTGKLSSPPILPSIRSGRGAVTLPMPLAVSEPTSHQETEVRYSPDGAFGRGGLVGMTSLPAIWNPAPRHCPEFCADLTGWRLGRSTAAKPRPALPICAIWQTWLCFAQKGWKGSLRRFYCTDPRGIIYDVLSGAPKTFRQSTEAMWLKAGAKVDWAATSLFCFKK